MLKWLNFLKNSDRETKLFIVTVILYTSAVMIPVIYCYARLDFVRSYETTQEVSTQKE